ncbi:unnamed protein product, partial [Amoebophrya sp. A25]
ANHLKRPVGTLFLNLMKSEDVDKAVAAEDEEQHKLKCKKAGIKLKDIKPKAALSKAVAKPKA